MFPLSKTIRSPLLGTEESLYSGIRFSLAEVSLQPRNLGLRQRLSNLMARRCNGRAQNPRVESDLIDEGIRAATSKSVRTIHVKGKRKKKRLRWKPLFFVKPCDLLTVAHSYNPDLIPAHDAGVDSTKIS